MTERKLQTAVVTGPTGAIGMALCRHLLDAGVTVYAVCRPGSPRAAALPRHPDLHQVECDATVLDTLRSPEGQALIAKAVRKELERK